MISTSIMRSTGEKKWMPMKRGGSLNSAASEVIGSVEVLEANTVLSPITAWILAITSDFDLAVLEHRLDHQVAILQRAVVRRRRDEREQPVALGAISCGLC